MVGIWPLLFARFDNPSGEHLTNAGQLRQLGPAGGIHVDLKFAVRTGSRSNSTSRPLKPPYASHHRHIDTSANATIPPTAA